MKSSQSPFVCGSPDSALTVTEGHPNGRFMDNQHLSKANMTGKGEGE